MEITRSVEAPKITWLMHEEPASLLLSFAAGFSDTAGFIALGGLFTAHITGSFVLVGAAIVNGTGGILARLLMIPVFIIAVAVVAAFSVYAKRRKLPTIPVLMVSEAMFLALFCTVGVALTPQQQFTFSDSAVFLIGACGVIAMGIQNALMRIELNTLLPTTIMTGNSTQFIIDLVYVLSEYNRTHGHLSADMAARAKKLRRYGYVLLGFVGGAAAGAYGIATWHFWSILIPCLIIALLAVASILNALDAKRAALAKSKAS